MFKRVLILMIIILSVNTMCFANNKNSLEQMYGNVIRFTTRICHDWDDLNKNFNGLEQNLKSLNGDITKDDIEDLKKLGIEEFTSNDDRKTAKTAIKKLNALTDAIDNYIDKCDSCCCQTAANGKTLMKMYLRNLKKYN